MKKNKKGAHAAEPSKSKKIHFILFIIVLFVILIGIYFMVTFVKQNEVVTQSTALQNNLTLSDYHVVENSSNLISKDFLINRINGISKVKGTIENISDDISKNLNLIYTLYDSSNNIVYEFEISISNLEAHNSSSFSSVCTTNLSNVTNYSVKLAE